MTDPSFDNLSGAIADPLFPEIDLALRRGQHIDRDEGEWYAFLIDAQAALETFYSRYGCELIHTSDGFFYLLPHTDQMGRRHLSAGEMLVGQTLALLYLDPATVQAGGVVKQDAVVSRLAGLIDQRSLIRALNPRRRPKKSGDHVGQRIVRDEITKALRGLCRLGFIESMDDGGVHLRCSVLRFAEAVRGLTDPAGALEQLVADGKAIMAVHSTRVSDNGHLEDDDDEQDEGGSRA